MSDEYRNALAVGTVLDTYRIERVLGEGGFGVTYLVTELNLGKEYAIKELIPDGVAIRQGGTTVMARNSSMEGDFATTRQFFIEEARVLATLKHPAIVAVHRLFEANGTCYMVMDYVEGETLGAYLKRQGGKLGSREEFEGIFYPIMDGLEVLHGKEMIHRDIKPGNIMVSPDGSPVLLDFGASCRVENHTVTIAQMASAGYSPYEQYMARAKQGPYTDIYALGATMVRAITGTKPDGATDRMMSDTYSSMTDRAELVPVYGQGLLSALDASVMVESEDRPQSVEELRELIGEEDSEEDLETLFELGDAYYYGWGVERNYEEAVLWYRLAADQGDADAQYNLGVMYADGEGVEKDDEEAVKWYRLAADQGHAAAQNQLGFMCDEGRGVQEDDVEAVRWYRLAADQGNATAQFNLGLMYERGEGVKEDDEEAVKWYRLAADQGHEEAKSLADKFRFSDWSLSFKGTLGIKKFRISQLIWFLLTIIIVLWELLIKEGSVTMGMVFFLFITLSVPSYVRRLHDLGKSGVSAIPMFISGIYLGVLLSPESDLSVDNLVIEWILVLCFLFSVFNYARLLFVRRTPDGNRSSA